MDRWDWMVVRVYTPCVAALMVAGVSMLILARLPDSPIAQGLMQGFRWVPALGLVAAMGLFLAPTYRLLQWHRGGGPSCPACGGPLGGEHAGHPRMGGAYRRCYACRKAVNHRHYDK